MTKSRLSLISNISAVLFVAAEATLFYLIHISKASSPISLRYLSIQLAAAFSLVFITLRMAERKGKFPVILFDSRKEILLGLSMLSTLAADYFLVASPEMKRMEGMLCFVGTQIFISLRILVGVKKEQRKMHLAVRAIATVLITIITLAVLGESADALAIVSVIYYINLIISMVLAPSTKPGGILLCIGLVLFALCDINVGLAVLNDLYGGGISEIPWLYKILHSGMDLVWIFYLPSQVVIPLTILISEESTKEKQEE